MAPYDFDSYLIYLEWDRPVEERFYQPRRKIMRRVADALQRLTDGELDELFFEHAASCEAKRLCLCFTAHGL